MELGLTKNVKVKKKHDVKKSLERRMNENLGRWYAFVVRMVDGILVKVWGSVVQGTKRIYTAGEIGDCSV